MIEYSPEYHSPAPPKGLIVDRAAAGCLAAAVTAATAFGMLLGMGHRSTTAWRPINALAHLIVGARADDVFGPQLVVTPAGCAVVLVMSALAGIAIAGLASSRRTLHIVMATGGVALAGYLVHAHIAARTPGGLAALLTLGELRALYASVAIATFLGMRYALAPISAVHPE
ncbi:MAG: hypothetical protein JWM95_4466 [Gemmatimonadetes bacterium]|nr:hypothetical protein [Gemmatimonadota bacterium]